MEPIILMHECNINFYYNNYGLKLAHQILYIGDGLLSGILTSSFVCSPGEIVFLDSICDGIADCSDGSDETTTLCES